MAEPVVKYSWQMGPFPVPEADCTHRQKDWPYNDEYSVSKCNGIEDEITCRKCGKIRVVRCNFGDGDFK